MSFLRELLFAERARAIIAARPPAKHAEIQRLWAAARSILDVAVRLDPRREQRAAIPLYRDGVIALAAVATAFADDAKPGDLVDVDAAWAALERVRAKLGISTPLDELVPGRDVLRERPPLDAPPRTIDDTVAGIDRLTRLVGRTIEPRSLRALRWRVRLELAAIAVVVAGVIAWTIPPLFAPPNVALHKPVKLSSVHPDSLSPPDGTWLDDGRVERTYGAHTNAEDDPWMQIDLEQPTLVKRVVIYNRGDGWYTDCLPLQLSLGDDERALRKVALRETMFTQLRPWVVETNNETARYVRVTTRGHAACALAEIEVYSR